ncbi:hypothetical protein PsorP6_008601 [Peronosclerospora sorghi]|uniref:Uncharacterized protein n=1 Tax=Peronosclerospora sorghi TaxID=230839 RepID=A0ACC0WA43_9STRA|nr:hypothetical protein PsorP6_008601 [Peronosclerospora sorghi]
MVATIPENRDDSSRDDDSDIGEPDPKQLRLTDGYEIALAVMKIPRTYKEPWRHLKPRNGNKQNHTWDTIHRLDGKRLILNKWGFDVKRDVDGNIVRYKARHVFQGFHQVYGADYWETYSPVSSSNSVRAFLALCFQRGYSIRQLDVDTAFLNGLLDEICSCVHRKGFDFLMLRRGIYGLKQSSTVWHKTILSVLNSMGFHACVSDPCVFVRHEGDFPVYWVLYVDDLLISFQYNAIADGIRNALAKHFTLKDLGDSRYILGIEMDYDCEAGTLHLCQSQFIQRLIEKLGQESAYPANNPNVYDQKLDELMMKKDLIAIGSLN